MNKVKARGTEILRLILVVGLLVVPSAAIRSQGQNQAPQSATQEQTSPSAPSQQDQNQGQQQADKSVSPTSPAQDQSKPATPGDNGDVKSDDKGEVKITPRQAEELFHSVHEILEFDSKQTGLPLKQQGKAQLT